MKKTFILHFDSLEVLNELSEKQTADLFLAIRDYNIWKENKKRFAFIKICV